MLACAATRQKEFAIRGAFDASRWRLIRLLLTESLLLAALSGAAGVLAAPWALSFLSHRTPNFDIDFEVDRRVLVFTFAIAFVAGLLAGVTQTRQAAPARLQSPP